MSTTTTKKRVRHIMATIDFGSRLNAEQTANLIIHCGTDINVCVEGEPGIGKSAMMKRFEAHFGSSYVYVYFDCGNKDLGDICMPSVNRDLRITEYFANAIFQLNSGLPAIIMLDEFAKAPAPVQNMLHPMLEAQNRRLGDNPLHKDSIVFITSNLASDGVGDTLKAHTANRVTRVKMRKPNADEWLEWAMNADIDPSLMAWVKQYPHALSSYLEGGQDGNHYIFNPRKGGQDAYVSPRSLEKMSNIIKKRSYLDAATLIAGLTGTGGEAAARDLEAFINYQDQLPSWDSIIKEPKKTKVPDTPGACAVLIFSAIKKIDKQSMTPFMDYLTRFELEWQAVFAVQVSKDTSKQPIAFTCPAFRDWLLANEDVL